MKQFRMALVLGGWLALGALAAPYTPRDESTVLERLPLRRSDPVAAELRQLRGAPPAPGARDLRRLRGSPLARCYFELAMAQGDPRYVGYAEAALRNAENDPPAE